jgi:hypothetical protein
MTKSKDLTLSSPFSQQSHQASAIEPLSDLHVKILLLEACMKTFLFKRGARLCATFLLLLLLFAVPKTSSADVPGDEFLKGYAASILEQGLNWSRDSYRLDVVSGAVTITMLKDDPAAREAAIERFNSTEALKGVAITVVSANDGSVKAEGAAAEKTWKTKGLPIGDLFHPLLSDPKQPEFFVSLDRFRSPAELYTMAEAGFGETFGICRLSSDNKGDGLQLSVEASLVARFNMDTPSFNLINADYSVGFPLTYRNGNNSIRLRLYHQSSHLGDEFLLLNPDHPTRINLSFEAVEFLYAREWTGMRGYIGGEYMVRRDPSDLKPAMAHFGIDGIGSRKFFTTGRFIAGVDFKSYEQHSWNIDTCVKFGLLFGPPYTGQRRFRLLAEWYRGYDPRGQFYMNRVSYYGLNLSLGF